jgi:hypothetical protein
MGIDLWRSNLFHPAMKRLTRSRCFRALAICAGLTLGACSKPADSIVGKWAKGNDTVITFTKDGQVISQEGSRTEEMEYTMEGGTNLYLKLKDAPTSIHFTVDFPGDREMTLTPQPPKDAIMQPQSAEPVHFTRLDQ